MDPEFRFVLVGFTCWDESRQLRIYEVGHSYAMPAAVARAAERRGFVAETRPADWTPPAAEAPRALTRGEMATAQAELESLRQDTEAPSPSGNSAAIADGMADPVSTPMIPASPAVGEPDRTAQDLPPTASGPGSGDTPASEPARPAPTRKGRRGAGLAFAPTLGLSAIWVFIAALTLAVAAEWALSRTSRPSVVADATPALRTRLDRISQDLDELRKASAQQQQLLKSLPLAALGADIAQNQKAVEALNADVAQNRQAVEALNADVERNRKAAEVLSADVGENRKAVERLAPDLRHVKQRMATLTREARELWGAPLRAARPVYRRQSRHR